MIKWMRCVPCFWLFLLYIWNNDHWFSTWNRLGTHNIFSLFFSWTYLIFLVKMVKMRMMILFFGCFFIQNIYALWYLDMFVMNTVMMFLANWGSNGMFRAWRSSSRNPFMIVGVVARKYSVNKKYKAIASEEQQVRHGENTFSRLNNHI